MTEKQRIQIENQLNSFIGKLLLHKSGYINIEDWLHKILWEVGYYALYSK